MQDETTKEQAPPVPAVKSPVDIEIWNGVFQADSLEKLWRLANIMSKSGLVPKEMASSVEKTFVAMACGLELGLKVMTSLQNIYIVNNRPTIFGDATLALCSDQIEWIVEDFTGTPFEDEFTAVCTVKVRGKEKPTMRSFSVGDAKTAKLWGKRGKEGQDTPWVTYPKRMLQMKARNFALRDACPGALKGIAIFEDVAYHEPEQYTSSPVIVRSADVVPDTEVIADYLTEEPIKKPEPEAKQASNQKPIQEPSGAKEEAAPAVPPAAPAEPEPMPDDHAGILAKLIKDEGLNKDNAEGLIADIIQRQRVSREEVLAQIAKEPVSFVKYYRSLIHEDAKPKEAEKKPQPAKGTRTRKPKAGPTEPPGPPPVGPAASDPVINIDPETGTVLGAVDPAVIKEDLSGYTAAELVIRAMCHKAHASDPEFAARGYSPLGVFSCYLRWAKESVARVSKLPEDKVLHDLANQGEPTIKLFKKWLFNPPIARGPEVDGNQAAKPPLETKVPPGEPVLQPSPAGWKERLAGLRINFPDVFEAVRNQMGFAENMPTEGGAKVFVEKIHLYLDQKRAGVKKPDIR